MNESFQKFLRLMLHKYLHIDFAVVHDKTYGDKIYPIYHAKNIWYVRKNDHNVELFSNGNTSNILFNWSPLFVINHDFPVRKVAYGPNIQFRTPEERKQMLKEFEEISHTSNIVSFEEFNARFNDIANDVNRYNEQREQLKRWQSNLMKDIGKDSFFTNLEDTEKPVKSAESFKKTTNKSKAPFKRPGFPLDPNDPEDLDEIYRQSKNKADRCTFDFLHGHRVD